MTSGSFRVAGGSAYSSAPSQEMLSDSRFNVEQVGPMNYIINDEQSGVRFEAKNGPAEVKAIEKAVRKIDQIIAEADADQAKVHDVKGKITWEGQPPEEISRFKEIEIHNPHPDLALQMVQLSQMILGSPMAEGAKLALKAYIYGHTTNPDIMNAAYLL